jgi:hypothetical protein
MKNDSINLSQYQSKSSVIENNGNSLSFQSIFKGDSSSNYLNDFAIYMAHFKTIPNVVPAVKIDCDKAQAWLIQNYSSAIKDVHYSKRYFHGTRAVELDDVFYFLFDDVYCPKKSL